MWWEGRVTLYSVLVLGGQSWVLPGVCPGTGPAQTQTLQLTLAQEVPLVQRGGAWLLKTGRGRGVRCYWLEGVLLVVPRRGPVGALVEEV